MTTSGDPTLAAIDAVREALRERMKLRNISSLELAERAGVSYNAVNEFLTGVRAWPRPSTRAKIELVLGWEPGTMAEIRTLVLRQGNPATTADDRHFSHVRGDNSRHVVVDFPPGALDGLSAAEVREVRAAAELAALERVRQIVAARQGGRRDDGGPPEATT